MGLHVKKDDMPLVASPDDELWIVFRDFEGLAVAWIQSDTSDAVVEVGRAGGRVETVTVMTSRA